MTRLHIGAVLDRLPSRRYCEQLPYCEYVPKAPYPRPSTLKRWFFSRHYDTEVGLVAPRGCVLSEDGKLQLERVPQDRFDWLCQAAAALSARYVRITTGREVTTGARDRGRLEELCHAVRERSGSQVVWAPGGIWEPEAAAEQAAKMGTGLSLDVLEHPVPPAPTLFGIAAAIGTRARLSRGHLDAAVQALLAPMPDDAYLAVEADAAAPKARTARDVALELAADVEDLEVVAPRALPAEARD